MNILQNWTDNVSVIAATTLTRGSTVRGTIDLRAKLGARIFMRVGRTTAAALTDGVDALIRPVVNNGDQTCPSPSAQFLSQSAVGVIPSVNADCASGQNEVKLASVTSLAAGDIVMIGNIGTLARLEWHRISKLSVAAGTGVTLDRPLRYTHLASDGDNLTNKADCFVPVFIAAARFTKSFSISETIRQAVLLSWKRWHKLTIRTTQLDRTTAISCAASVFVERPEIMFKSEGWLHWAASSGLFWRWKPFHS